MDKLLCVSLFMIIKRQNILRKYLTLEIYFPSVVSPEPCFLLSIKSVLDLNAFERQNKAEGLGMVTEEGTRK